MRAFHNEEGRLLLVMNLRLPRIFDSVLDGDGESRFNELYLSLLSELENNASQIAGLLGSCAVFGRLTVDFVADCSSSDGWIVIKRKTALRVGDTAWETVDTDAFDSERGVFIRRCKMGSFFDKKAKNRRKMVKNKDLFHRGIGKI